eukprot:TRINITY_DN960_c0_g1_i2.p1 TRINITY_DN960_c0_g1~~TRINITY_DN960_c0_g1_i2.p1  ORF type:complete len:825 (-),score=175.49 TRINITY_DN960_c0_g1_i2:265-2739(-)
MSAQWTALFILAVFVAEARRDEDIAAYDAAEAAGQELTLLQQSVEAHPDVAKVEVDLSSAEAGVGLERGLVVDSRGAVHDLHVRIQDGALNGTSNMLVQFNMNASAPADVAAPSATAGSLKEEPEVTPVTTTANPLGVKLNGAGDLPAFLSALATNLAIIAFCVYFFQYAKNKYPIMYWGNVLEGIAPGDPRGAGWQWLSDAWNLSSEDVARSVGLDAAMLLQFTSFSMRLCFLLSLPLLFVLSPLHLLFGGSAAGDDRLSYLSIGNVYSCGTDDETGKRLFPDFNGCWIYYVHAFAAWLVVFFVQVSVYKQMEAFLPRRYKWLRELPEPRNTTLMITGIEADLRSDEKLKVFFAKALGQDKVKTAYVTRLSPTLEDAKRHLDLSSANLKEAEATWKQNDNRPDARPTFRGQDSINLYTQEVKRYEEEYRLEKDKLKHELSGVGGVYCSTGFVTFHKRTDAEIALNLQFKSDAEVMNLEIAPEPTSIIWNDLQKHSSMGSAGALALGYVLIVALYFLYTPIVIYITTIAQSINLGPLQPLWAGVAPTLGLTVMVSFLPTILIMIFRLCFVLTADVWAQKNLQNTYFVFQIVFVILITSVGYNVKAVTETLVTEPFQVFGVMADSMPQATHFYMNYLVLQWTTHAMNLTRYVQLGKFVGFSALYEEKDAKAMSEPEDQDYYGMGSRSSRFTINLLICIVFGTLSPPMTILAWINFFLCRVFYGYLIPFAETKKPDTGGAFFVQQLQHVFWGNIIYCILTIGVLLRRGDSFGPAIIAAPTLLYVIWSMRRFSRKFTWQKLPFMELSASQQLVARSGAAYVQAEYEL